MKVSVSDLEGCFPAREEVRNFMKKLAMMLPSDLAPAEISTINSLIENPGMQVSKALDNLITLRVRLASIRATGSKRKRPIIRKLIKEIDGSFQIMSFRKFVSREPNGKLWIDMPSGQLLWTRREKPFKSAVYPIRNMSFFDFACTYGSCCDPLLDWSPRFGNQPMIIPYMWGYISHMYTGHSYGMDYKLVRMWVDPNNATPNVVHSTADRTINVSSGTGHAIIGNDHTRVIDVSPGSVLTVPKGTPILISSGPSGLGLLETQTGDPRDCMVRIVDPAI